MSLRVISNKPIGFVLVAAVTIITVMLFMAAYFLEQSTSEIKISKSENSATKTYYLSEAGANESVYKLKNDAVWKAKFLAGTLNNDSSVRNNVFDANGNYTITATSISPGLADITVTATYTIGSKQSKRIIKTRLARAVEESDEWNQSLYGGGKGGQQNGFITFTRDCTLNGGTIHANQNVKIQGPTITVNNGNVTASNNIITNAGGKLILNNSSKQEGTADIAPPTLDFDSASQTSLKNRANQTYTASQFQNLPTGTTLNGITYVSGDANWTNKNLTINGILASSGTINISLNSGKTLTVNSNAAGSGLLAKSINNITSSGATININGLVYATGAISISASSSSDFTVTGGVAGWKLDIGGSSGTCTINYDKNLASGPLDPVLNGTESPIIAVNHWEEQY